MIDQLPLELQLLISGYLPQSDCYHLMLCNRALYHSCIKRLYGAIVIESKLNYFHEELSDSIDIRKVPYVAYDQDSESSVLKYHSFKTSIIRTSFGLKSFFKALRESKNGYLSDLIEYLEVSKDLPEHFIEFELAKNFKFVLFPNLNNLKILKFYYNSCFINLNDLLITLPEYKNGYPSSNGKLISIDGDFNTLIGKQKKSPVLQHNLINLLNSNSYVVNSTKGAGYKSIKLQQLTLTNFEKSSCLANLNLSKSASLVKNLKVLELSRFKPTSHPVNYSVVNSIGIDLNYLQDCFNKYFYNGMTNNPTNDFNSLFRITTTTANNSSNSIGGGSVGNDIDNVNLEKEVLSKLFPRNSRITNKLELFKLKLDGIFINSSDAAILIRNLDLSKLTSLQLLDTTEILDSSNSRVSYDEDDDENGDDNEDGEEFIMEDFEVPAGMTPEEAERLALEAHEAHNNRRRRVRRSIGGRNDEDHFLHRLTPFLENLTELSLDLYNDIGDAGPYLISNLNRLKTCYINLRWNSTKERYSEYTFDELVFMYFKALVKNCKTLQSLVIDTKNEMNVNISPIFQRGNAHNNMHNHGNVNSTVDYEIKGIKMIILQKALPILSSIKSLRLPIHQKNLYEFSLVLKKLPHLEYLELIFPEFNRLSDSTSINNNNSNTSSGHSSSMVMSPSGGFCTSPNSSVDFLPLSIVCGGGGINDNNYNNNSMGNKNETIKKTIEEELDSKLVGLLFNKNGNTESMVMNELEKLLNIDLHPTEINLIKIRQIAIIFKKLVGMRDYEFFGYCSDSLRYIKVFNTIVDVRNIEKVKVKSRGLDEWFNGKLSSS